MNENKNINNDASKSEEDKQLQYLPYSVNFWTCVRNQCLTIFIGCKVQDQMKTIYQLQIFAKTNL